MKKVVYIPLDMRPCNTTWIKKFSQRGNIELIHYPFDKTGTLLNPSNQKEMLEFILNESIDADYLLLSLDALTSGGLVQSRLGVANFKDSILQKDVFVKIKNKNPNIKIYAFDTLMRTSVTSYGYESANIWEQINAYAKLVGKLNINYDDKLQEELNILTNKINKQDLNRFLDARKIKHEMNKFYIELVKDKILDYLTILQEDCMVDGLQMKEQIILNNLIIDNNLTDTVKLYNGTDEGASVLLAKIIAETNNIDNNIFIHTHSNEALNNIQVYEDRPFIENINSMFEVIGLNRTYELSNHMVLSIFSAERQYSYDERKTIFFNKEQQPSYQKYINELNQFIETNNVAFLDIFRSNGGIFEILQMVNYEKLSCYSAWNTASNSLGSILCDIVCFLVQKNKDKNFLYERIIDDCIYQTVVREKLNERLQSEGINLYNFEDNIDYVQSILLEEMKKYDHMHYQKYNMWFPWKRSFEIDINVGEPDV
ncbi:DUF4127 family protein [Acholeplasma granularum]|uniref:DUF4127 family protein n=1 Tax=Acholeplasma granularum TaxID=264635 RepID=UPI0004ADD85D|nr:DUF4127 family protein [Acholeplasma granularum]